MQRRRKDAQIFWVCLFAVLFWTVIWQHEAVVGLVRKSPIPKVIRWMEGGTASEK
jgi:hypothetical protein